MTQEAIIEVVETLVGFIKPIGSTNIDNERLENLETMCGVVDALVNKIKTVSHYENSIEFSMKRAGKYAHDFLKELNQSK